MTALGSAPTPVPLSSLAELERQDKVAVALAQLLATTSPAVTSSDEASWAAALAGTVASPYQEVETWVEELERLRCRVHLGDLQGCRSEHRLFAINFACNSDPALREEERRLFDATESQRQQFFNGIFARIKRDDFAGFNFPAASYKEAFETERQHRLERTAKDVERIKELEGLLEPCFRQRLTDCGEAVANFPWQSIAAAGEERWRTGIDALTLESKDDLWFVAEARPPDAESSQPNCNAERLPCDVLLLVDLSGSMCDLLPVLKECLHDVESHARDGDRLCLIGFSSEPHLLCDWVELADPAASDTRRILQSCVEAMLAKGGTCLVPALRLAGEQLRGRPATTGPRSTAVVLLSDGDPQEPPEALSSAAARAFEPWKRDAPLVVALALGEESRPDLMALLAQCGCGASLYIAGRDHLPSQLGRMWGILGTQSTGGTSGRLSTTDAFLILEGAEGTSIIETERSPGGVCPFVASDGRRLVAMRCGRHIPPGDSQGCCRLAARLSLPEWAAAPIDGSFLQRPLLRTTWVWRCADGAVRAASDTLRAVQVPALLIEARLGLPLRVVLSADGAGCESFDRAGFLSTLSAALGIGQDNLSLDRLSPGSIIADLQLVGADLPTVEKVRAAFRSLDVANIVQGALVQNGFPATSFSAPGGRALRRVLQWRLAAALEVATNNAPSAHEALAEVGSLASSEVALLYDCDPDPAHGGVAAIAADAQVAAEKVKAIASNAGESVANSLRHELEMQAHAHAQQLCPELTPDASAVRGYESDDMRLASEAFLAKARIRDGDILPAAPILFFGQSSETGGHNTQLCNLRIRSGDSGDAAVAVTAFQVVIHYGSQTSTAEVRATAGLAATAEGMPLLLEPIESDAEHAIVARASFGRGVWGPTSQTMLCSLQGASHKVAGPRSPNRRGSRRATRSSTITRVPAGVVITEASATLLGTLSLAWEMLPQAAPNVRWMVSVESADGAPNRQEFSAEDLEQCRASFTGLMPSATYKFRIAANQPLEQKPSSPGVKLKAPVVSRGSFESLSIQGIGIAAPLPQAEAPSAPRAVEGVLATPPFDKAAVAKLDGDSWLHGIGIPGVYLKVTGGRGRRA